MSDEVVQRVLDLWDRLDGWIPGAAYAELAEALGVPADRLLETRRKRQPFRTPGFDGPEGTEWEARPWHER